MNRPAERARHPAEVAVIGVYDGRARFGCRECERDVAVLLTCPDALIDAWEVFVRDHRNCLQNPA
jgi:hypothetical protein